MHSVNQEAVERFLEGRGLAPKSARNYRDVLGQLDRFLKGKPFHVMTEEDLRRFMRTRSIKPRTYNHHVILLKTFFRVLHGFRKYTYPDVVAWLSGNHRHQTLPVVSITRA